MWVREDKREETACVWMWCVSICQPETFCLSNLLRTRPHSLAPVLVCLLSTGVCGWLDRLCWFWSMQQCCSRRSHTEFKFTSDTRISVIPKPQILPFHQNTGGGRTLVWRGGRMGPQITDQVLEICPRNSMTKKWKMKVFNNWYSPI